MSFKSVQSHIEKEGYTKEQAGAILAKKTREASPAAKRANPNLQKVKMPKKSHPDEKAHKIVHAFFKKHGM